MPSSPSPTMPKSLWHDPDFRRLWIGQTASQLGAQAVMVTLPLIAVLALDASAGELGLLRAVEQAPVLLFSLLAGAWVDRRRSRDVLVGTDFGRALALTAIPVAFAFGLLGMPVLLVVAFTVGVLGVFFDVAYHASLVRLVDRDRLTLGNSALEGSRSAAQVAGPALGGTLVSLFSAPVAAASAAVFFVWSFVAVRRIQRVEVVARESGPVEPVWRRIGAGLRFVVGNGVLRAVGLASAAYQFSFAAMMTVYLLFLPRELGLPGSAVGVALAAPGPGAILGSVLAARLPGRFGYGVVMVSAAALADVVLLALPGLDGSGVVTVALLVAVNFVFGACGQLVNVTVMAVRQAITPVAVQGRVVATINFAGMGMMPFGSLLGGFLADAWGLRTGLLLAVLGMTLSPLSMALSPLRRLGRRLPEPCDGPR
ncbi:MFS transporter [Phytomonospora sp. NPDC050363]|uniref:MFS transporter n=1 Tax=Phytomonospora sp. NPDC050363 TaxID=3155642 RepID=UPI0033ED7416